MNWKTCFLFSIAMFTIITSSNRTRVTSSYSELPHLIPRVHNLNSNINYSTIQEAIDANETVDGHTLIVNSGVYYERVQIHKSLKVLGENAKTTTIDGGNLSTVVHINSSGVSVSGFTIRNSGRSYLDCGVFLDYCFGSNVSHNIVTRCRYAVYVFHSRGNILMCNNVSGNYEDGIWLYYSGNNTLIGNNASGNRYNLGVFGGSSGHFNNAIDTSNKVDGKPVQYLMGVSHTIINDSENTGTLYLIDCYNMTVRDLVLTENGHGVFLWNTTNSCVENLTAFNNNYGIYLQDSTDNELNFNNCSNNWVGISLQDSERNIVKENILSTNEKGISLYEADANTLLGNLISNNLFGIRFFASNLNKAWLNNLIDNYEQVSLINSYQNSFDDGIEGNFWSDYTGTDVDLDGVGDFSFRGDTHPLMGMFSVFNTPQGFNINVISNSTIEHFSYFRSNSTIRMQLSNSTSDQISFFCRITIPISLISEPYNVVIEDGTPSYLNQTLLSNDTHRWIYFSHTQTISDVTIVSEVPVCIVLLLFMGVTFLIVNFIRHPVEASKKYELPQTKCEDNTSAHARELHSLSVL